MVAKRAFSFVYLKQEVSVNQNEKPPILKGKLLP